MSDDETDEDYDEEIPYQVYFTFAISWANDIGVLEKRMSREIKK